LRSIAAFDCSPNNGEEEVVADVLLLPAEAPEPVDVLLLLSLFLLLLPLPAPCIGCQPKFLMVDLRAWVTSVLFDQQTVRRQLKTFSDQGLGLIGNGVLICCLCPLKPFLFPFLASGLWQCLLPSGSLPLRQLDGDYSIIQGPLQLLCRCMTRSS
jgi:hypothetical protein